MTMQTQIYKGKFGDQRPTTEQLALMERMGVKKEVMGVLDRAQAYELIRAIMVRYYTDKFEKQRKPFEVYIRW